MTGQLPLPFELREEYELGNFVRGDAVCARLGELAVAGSNGSGDGAMIWICAPTGCGKTHVLQGLVAQLAGQGVPVVYLPARRIPLADVHQVLEGLHRYQVVCIDDIDHWLGDGAVETELVRLYQERRQAGTHLVLSAAQTPANTAMALADWQSRAQGAEVFRLPELSEEDRLAVIMARAERLGLSLGAAEGSYLLRHAPRSLTDLLAVLERADRLTLAEQRRLTVPVLRKVLAEYAESGRA